METTRTYSEVLSLISPSQHIADRAWQALCDYAQQQNWCAETLRARWDGVQSLLFWWQYVLSDTERPPLESLTPEEARAYLN